VLDNTISAAIGALANNGSTALANARPATTQSVTTGRLAPWWRSQTPAIPASVPNSVPASRVQPALSVVPVFGRTTISADITAHRLSGRPSDAEIA